MSRIVWDEAGKHLYECGVECGVLYPKTGIDGAYATGVPWNGLISVTEKPSGAEPTPIWADNMKYLTLISAEEFAAAIEAYYYPDEFGVCDGSADIATGVHIGQQPRKPFGLCYKTKIGNDTNGSDHGYKLHIIYGALAAPSEKAYSTVNDSPEANTFSWEISTTPVAVPGFKPTACITLDSTKVDATGLAALEAQLYGVDAVAASGTEGQPGYVAAVEAVTPSLPTPAEVMAFFDED